MDTRRRDTLSAVTARQHGRTRMRIATIALGAAGLAGAGAVAYSLPAVTHCASSAPAHVVSGGS
jgi:hypothetical protein